MNHRNIDPPSHGVQIILKSRVQTVLLLVCLAMVRGLYGQATQDSTLSLQGFSGVLNTPNAHVQQEGTFAVLYSNQKDLSSNQNDSLPGDGLPTKEDSYLFSVGLFRFAEVGGRLTNTETDLGLNNTRHLSTTLKLSSASWTSRFRFSPAVAVGLEDVGGQTHYLDTKYLVGSADPAGWLRLSAGYGGGPDRMKGPFAGMELRAHNWVTLLGDYDTVKTNVGVRLNAPPLPHFPARLTATITKPLQHNQDLAIGVGLIVPFDLNRATRHRAVTYGNPPAQTTLWGALTWKRVQRPAPTPSSQSNTWHPAMPPYHPTQSITVMPAVESSSQSAMLIPQPPAMPPYRGTKARPAIPAATPSSQSNLGEPGCLVLLRDRLIQDGFVNVRVGLQGETLVVEYENIRYNHNELDAIGVVAGIVSQTAGEGAEQLRLVVRRKGLALLEIGAPLEPLRKWLQRSVPTNAPEFTVTQRVTNNDGVRFLAGGDNPGRLKLSVMVYPSVTTLVGTEYGVFDYQLSIRPELQLPLWRGATAVARMDLPVAWSGNLDSGRIYAAYHTPAQVDRLMFFQALPLAPGLVANLGAGKILTTDYGMLNEVSWTVGNGMNRFKAIQSWGRDTGSTRTVLLGSYRLFLARRDLAFEAILGRFYGQDTGSLLSMQRFFGDSAVSLYFKDTVTPTDQKRWLQAGIQFEFPLTPRRDMKAKPIQIRGNEDWLYAQETGVASSAGQSANYVEPDLATVPAPTQDLALYYYDRERLNSDYILSHTERIWEAWWFFRGRL